MCSYLESEEKNPVCGTRLPDLGPKLYIARPRIQLGAEGRKEFEVRPVRSGEVQSGSARIDETELFID